MALVDTCELITNSIDNPDYCAGVFIDLSKHLIQLIIQYSSQNYSTMEFVVLH